MGTNLSVWLMVNKLDCIASSLIIKLSYVQTTNDNFFLFFLQLLPL